MGGAGSQFVEGEAESLPADVKRGFAPLSGSLEIEELSSGLLHRTYGVRSGDGDFVLQRVSEVFAPEIHENIEAVTRHLAARGFVVPELLPTRSGERFLELGEGGRWRLMTRLPGTSFESVQSSAQARSAGALVGRFHAALDDFEAPLAPMGLPFFDTPAYRGRLHAALERHADHPARPVVETLAGEIEAGFERLGPVPEVPSRVIHGDLKISNLLFEGASPPENSRATALIDLDTLMRAPLHCEWGDAWRSWCAVLEDEAGRTAHAEFDLEIFRASLEGYREGLGRPVPETERTTLVLATDRIALELAMRFATDALEERYFAWDAARYESASAHQQARARGQIALAKAAWRSRRARAAILDAVLG